MSTGEVHEELSIRISGRRDATDYTLLLDLAIKRAFAIDHKLPRLVLDMEGMSGRKYRYLINNLIASIPDARYLEVGTWAGSTACAAMFGNKVKVTCIDNWSQFGGPRDKFIENTNNCRSEMTNFRFIESDFREVNYQDIGKYNVYLFDGPHEYEDQRDGLLLALPALDEETIFIVDDWNWPFVREGTFRALRECGLEIVYSAEIRSTQDDNHPVKSHQKDSDWHNGYFLCVLRKS
jgi:hypothetical protein